MKIIRVTKSPDYPQILVENQENWTNELLEELKVAKSFSKLPQKYIKRYKSPEIKNKLLEESHYKCVFCEMITEESSPAQVEHFKPKSIYPELTYEWSNLLTVCPICNSNKRDLDTEKKPIINPTVLDPENYFEYKIPHICVKNESPNSEIADRTIKKCKLNRPSLMRKRCDLFGTLHTYVYKLNELLNEIGNQRRFENRVNDIRESLMIIERLADEKRICAGFVRDFIRKNNVFQEIKQKLHDFDS